MSQRTTLTLEDDVVARLKREARRTGKPLKAVVNEALRRGLERDIGSERPPFRVLPRPLGVRPGIDLDDVQGLIELVEGPG